MPKLIQIRRVPDAAHRRLKVKAAMAGKTLSDFLLEEVVRLSNLPTNEELLARIHARDRVQLTESSVDALRAERGGR